MSIVKLFRKLYDRANPKQVLAFIAVLAMVASLIQPASMVHAADDTGDQRQMEKIESFTGRLERGATLDDQGRYIWTADHDAEDHKFIFRVDYSMSGVKELAPGAIKIWIPKTILKDRNGKYADEMDLTIPSQEEYEKASKDDQKMVDYIWETPDASDEKHKNWVEITNVKERTAGENGYFEVSYATSKKTYEYTDMCRSDPFKAEIQVTNTSEGAPQTVTAETDEIPVYINTTAEIRSTIKKYPSLIKTWQSSWGDQPEETKGMWFLVWQVISEIKKPTQYYTFSLEDKPVSDELHLIGYSMGEPDSPVDRAENGPYTSAKSVSHQSYAGDRYDYVLTYYSPEHFKDDDQYELENSVKATVTPEDGIDAPTSATSKKVWEWDTPKFARPPGHFYGLKFGDGSWSHLYDYDQKYRLGNTEWHRKYDSQECSSYSLDQFQEGKKEYLDFAFAFNVYGFPAPWTVKIGGDPFNPDDYQKTPVKYEMTDEELYLHENIKAEDIGADQLKFTIPENAHRLTAEDYQFMSARWQVHSEWRKFDKDEQRFVIDDTGKYGEDDRDDIVHFWVKSDKTEDGKYTEVASYNLGTGKKEILNSDVVDSLDGEEIKYKESANVTGIRFTTSNPYWYTNLSATPIVRLKNSKFVMDRVKDRDLVRLYNFSHSDAYDHSGKKLYGLKNYGYDKALRPKRDSELVKRVVSAGSDKIRKKYIIRWYIREKETVTTDDENLTANAKTEYLTQKSGKFYDLLPKGLHLQKGSVDIETEKGPLSKSSYSYSVEQDYKGSGRDMITVDIPVAAKYYNFYFNSEISWDSIRELGRDVLNPVAYETGNDDIAHGCPDDGGLSDGEQKLDDVNIRYMSRTYNAPLDPECGEAKRFLYNEEPHNIDTLTAAVSGLRKQIKDSRDSEYSYSTYTVPNGHYSYKIRFANTSDRAKNLIFYDSLENYNLNGKHSDWHGRLQRFDLSQMRKMGVDPVVYVSDKENLSFERAKQTDNASEVWYPHLDDSQFGWQKVTDDTDLSKMNVHAFAINCRKAANGDPFILKENETISAVVYMKAPGPGEVKMPDSSVNEKGEKIRSKAYNNIYIYDTIQKNGTESTYFIHQDYTEIAYHFSADVRIHKQNARDENEAIEGAKYRLEGTSDYGSKVDVEETTGAQGNAVFEDIEEGTYRLTETYSPADWLTDRTEYEVRVFTEKNENGDAEVKVTCRAKDGDKDVEKTDDKSRFIMKDAPRLHGDLVFRKKSTAHNAPIEGAKFRLTGKSYYKNDIVMYATSDDYGKVKFDNVEYGDYKLKEVEPPKGFIANPKEYSVSISDTGIGSIIDPDETADDGTVIIRNEPYHTVTIAKQSNYDGKDIAGAEFRLSGTSDRGNAYDRTATSAENGNVRFTDLESGEYTLEEIKAPDGFEKSDTKHLVKVKKDDSYTVSGLDEKDIAGNLIKYNVPKNDGRIVVKKVWNDGKTDNSERPTPVIHITTDVNQTPNYAVWGIDRLSYGNDVYSDNARHFKYADDITGENDARLKNAKRMDVHRYDNISGKPKIWVWAEGDTIYYWTNAKTTMLTDYSHQFFENSKFKDIDFSHISTSMMTDMSDMFSFCENLTSLDLSHFDTSNVTNMYEMFQYCGQLNSEIDLDLTGFDTSKVTNMSRMFYRSNFKSINLTSFDTSKVTDMSYMFTSCKNIEELNLSSFDTSSLKNIQGMFLTCKNLSHIYVSEKWNIKISNPHPKIEDKDDYDFKSSSGTDPKKVDGTYQNQVFYECDKLKEFKRVYDTFYHGGKTEIKYSHTPNINDEDETNGRCGKNLNLNDVVTIPGARHLYVSLRYSNDGGEKFCMWAGNHPDYNASNDQDYKKNQLDSQSGAFQKLSDYDGQSTKSISGYIDGDTVTFGFKNGEHGSNYGYYATISEATYKNGDSSITAGRYYDHGVHAHYLKTDDLDTTGYLEYKPYALYKEKQNHYTPFSPSIDNKKTFVSTDKDHCTILKDGDTWTYSFKVVDENATYYAWEDRVDGYSSSVDDYEKTTKDNPLVITNTLSNYSKPETTSLSIQKKVDGEQLVETNRGPDIKYSHTPNIDNTGKASDGYDENLNLNDVVTIPGAYRLHIKLYYNGNGYTCVWAGNHPEYNASDYYDQGKSQLGIHKGSFSYSNWSLAMSDAKTAEGYINGDTVTFGFSDRWGEGCYGYYAVISDASYVQKKQPDGTQKWYQLSDINTADIPEQYKNKSYMFNITLKGDSSELSGTKILGNTIFTDGKAKVAVKAGETKTITGIPYMTNYTVEEEKDDNFYAESEYEKGYLNYANPSLTAIFTNHYQKPKEKERNGFTLEKNVTGFCQKSQPCVFDVSLKNLEPDTEYTLSDGTKFKSDADGYGYVQVKMDVEPGVKKHIKFDGLPVGARYMITEKGGDWTSECEIENGKAEGETAQKVGNADKNTDLSTEWETVDKDEDITVRFTNTINKYQSLILKKVLDKDGGKSPGKFKFRIDFSNLKETVRSDAGMIVPDPKGEASAEVYIGADEQVAFRNIPVTTQYRITEEKNAGAASYEIKTDNGLKESNSNGDEIMKDLSTKQETVDEGENAVVTFKNRMIKSADISLTKKVTGLYYDSDRYFRFTVTLKNATHDQSYAIDLKKASRSFGSGQNPLYINTDKDGNGTADIWLKHGETAVLKNLPLKATYSITEEKTEGYETTVKLNNNEVDGISNRTISQPDDVVFINRNGGVLPTGLRSKTTIAMICTAIVFLISFFAVCSGITKKRKEQ